MSRIRLVLLPPVVAGLSLGLAACGDDDDDSSEAEVAERPRSI